MIVLIPEDWVLIVNEDPISEIKILFESNVSDVNVPIETTPVFAIIWWASPNLKSVISIINLLLSTPLIRIGSFKLNVPDTSYKENSVLLIIGEYRNPFAPLLLPSINDGVDKLSIFTFTFNLVNNWVSYNEIVYWVCGPTYSELFAS